MKLTTIIILTFILAFTSCKGEYNSSTADHFAELQEKDQRIKDTTTLEYYPVFDDKQQVIGAYPFPSDWYLADKANDSLFIQNALGAKVFKTKGEYFTDFRSSKLNKENKTWTNAAPLKTIKTIIKEKFIPFADSLNIELTNQFEIPELEEILNKNSSLYYTLIKPEENTFKVIATEWLDNKGIKSIVVITYNSQVFENETIWGYSIDIMEVPVAYFDTSKETFLYGLKNYKNCFQHIYDQNKINSRINYDYTSVHYTIKERQARNEAKNKEKQRTGMHSKNIDEYLEFLTSKGFLTDMATTDICNLKAYYKKEKEAEENIKHYRENIHFDPYPNNPEKYIDWNYKNPNEIDPIWDESNTYIETDSTY